MQPLERVKQNLSTYLVLVKKDIPNILSVFLKFSYKARKMYLNIYFYEEALANQFVICRTLSLESVLKLSQFEF